MLWARRPLVPLAIILAVGCHHSPPAGPPTPTLFPAAPLALSAAATQRIILLPSFGMSVSPEIPIAQRASFGPSAVTLERLDSALAAVLSDRGITRAWILPSALERDFKRSPTYVTDPHLLFEIPLLVPNLAIANTAPSELAAQIRTYVSFHDGSRFVLAPVALRFEPGLGGGVGARLRLVMLDGRTGEVTWIGDVNSETRPAFDQFVLTSLAERVAGLVVQ